MNRMPAHRILSFTDPRLGMRMAEARADDMATRAAMRILDDLLAATGDGLIAAPAIGLPVRCLALRRGAEVIHVLNPAIPAAGDFALNRAETSPLTGPIRRHVWRARQVTLTGTHPTGLPVHELLEGRMAVLAQQALDLLDNRAGFDWITPFHRAWVASSDPALRARAEAVNRALHLAPWQGDPGIPAGTPLVALDRRQVQIRDDAGQPVALLDPGDPALPIDATDRRCLGILFTAPVLRQVMILSRQRAALAVSLLTILPGITLHHPASGWPQRAMEQMQLSAACRVTALRDPPPLPDGPDPKMDAIVMDGSDDWLQGPEAAALMRQQARRLNGNGGIAVICCASASAMIEDLLQAVFPSVHVIDERQAGTLYLAFRSRPDLPAAHARALRLSNQLGRPGLVQPATGGWQILTRSGERRAP